MTIEWFDAKNVALDILIKVAAAGKLITYRDLCNKLRRAKAIDMHHRSPKLCLFLDEMNQHELLEGRPLISAVVVHQGNKKPGNGFEALCRRLKQNPDHAFQRGRAYEYWRNHPWSAK